MTTRIRTILPLAAVLTVAFAGLLIVAFAAGDQDGGSGIPTAGGSDKAAPTSTTDTTAAPVDQADTGLVYAQCVRDSGYPEFPDPDADGRISLHGEGAHDQDDPRLRAAMEACQDLRPAGLDHQDFGDPDFVEAMFEFAQCMRENGLPDFPDPGPDGRLVIGHGTVDRNDPRFQAALQTCYESVPGVAH